MTKLIRKSIAIILFSLSSIAGYSQEFDISFALFELPDVVFEEIDTPDGFEKAYKLFVKQPIDHNNQEKGHFYQKVYLSHLSVDAPNVIITEGYNRNRNRIYELSKLLKANQIDVEHRFFGESIPDSIEYKYLNLEQATADLHRVRILLGEIYKSNWISSGISKGGQTSIYYKYFYPDDVVVSVPYVAPLNISLEETRIYDFLDTIGSDNCRDEIYQLQQRIFDNREEAFDKLKWYAKGAELSYTYLSFEEAMEYAILEYPFSFWQWGASCDEIPGKEQSLDEALDHFLDASGISFFSDRDMEAYKSHYYQAGTQMGYYSYSTKGFEDDLEALSIDPNPSAVFMPDKMDYVFDSTLANTVYDWIQKKGDKFIYINGANDTWSATAVPYNKKRNSVWFNMPGKDHGQARIRNMEEKDRIKLIATLEDWLDLELKDIFKEDK